jgi:hypothetical protein
LREEHRLRVFENRVLRRIFGPKRDEVAGEWRKQHNEEIKGLHSSPNVIRVIKSIRMSWAGHAARMVERRGVEGFWWGSLTERDHLEYPSLVGRIILRCIFRKWDVEAWTGLIWLRIGTALTNAVMNLWVP